MTNVIWDKITRDSKVFLPEDKTLKSFNGEPRQVKKGWYFITGFWVDMAGLATEKPYKGNDVCIQSRELSHFLK